VAIAAIFYFYLVLKYPNSFLPPLKKSLSRTRCGRGWGGFFELSVSIFLAVSFLSAIFGANFSLSFWGNLERGGGVWGLIHFVLFFWMLSSIFQKKEDWISLLKFSVGASALVSFLALVQKFASISILIPQSERVFSTLGNSGFLAVYLIFNIFSRGI